MAAFNLETCVRPNILALQPYRCARDDYKDDGNNILLDANENAYGPSLVPNGHNDLDKLNANVNGDFGLSTLNRYPDPHQFELKRLLCHLRQIGDEPKPLTPANLFVGVGSDEAIDALIRCFCVPAVDKILTCPPTYGMYKVCAQINDVSIVNVPLELKDGLFDLRPDEIIESLKNDSKIKLVYICSPGNPTGKLIDPEALKRILAIDEWNGVVVLDEAYIDFAQTGSSLASWVNYFPNLVVMQTLSKGFGMAGIRLGFVFAPPPIASILNNLKAPYNISTPTSKLARSSLSPPGLKVMYGNISRILTQRDRLIVELKKIPGIGNYLGGFNANFLLVEILNRPDGEPDNATAKKVYERLAEAKNVVVRFRGTEPGCTGCLRVTVGTEAEVTKLLTQLSAVLIETYAI